MGMNENKVLSVRYDAAGPGDGVRMDHASFAGEKKVFREMRGKSGAALVLRCRYRGTDSRNRQSSSSFCFISSKD